MSRLWGQDGKGRKQVNKRMFRRAQDNYGRRWRDGGIRVGGPGRMLRCC